jgi:hypothetical protein
VWHIDRGAFMAENGKTDEHRFIQRTGAKPKIAEVKKIAAYILDHYTGIQRSPSQYIKAARVPVSWSEKDGQKEVVVSFEDIVSHIQRDRTFDAALFGLGLPPNYWLDSSVAVGKPDGPVPSVDGKMYLKFAPDAGFGPSFPVEPCIDREGVAFSSFQNQLQSNITKLHAALIDSCSIAPQLGRMMEWFNDLRMLLNECATIVDITLHQTYFKAEYGPRPAGWTFDPEKLGRRQGVRLRDKLQWIGKITGKPLDDARDEVASFIVLKDIRNHWNHFDPPGVAYTMEDVVGWLNRVPDIGRLLWKIRAKMKVPLSKGIVEIITLPTVMFVPRDPAATRLAQGDDVGYRSSIWP